MRRTSDWLVDSLLPETPPPLLAALYLAAVLFLAVAGIETLARTNQVTLPLLTGLGILVSSMTMPEKDYRLLLPLLERGAAPVLHSAWLAMGILGELCLLGMFVQYVRDPRLNLRAGLLAVAFGVMTMTGPVSGAVAVMGHQQAAGMPYPSYQHWLMISFTRFVERSDLLAVHQWLVGAYVRIGLFLFALTLGSRQLVSARRSLWFAAGGGLLVWALSVFAFPDILAFDAFVTGLYLPAGAVLGVVLPPLLWALAAARGLLPGRGGHR